MTWKAGSDTSLRGYKFTYDGLERLTTAVYGEGTGITANPDHYSENITGYTRNGAITGLQRYGKTTSGSYALIDNLTYTLSGNQLQKVTDAATETPANGGMHFVDGTNQTTEYLYDANGNMTQDLNKGITISYNDLNLPASIATTSGNITYLYAADGVKQRVVHGTAVTDYCGNFIYENGTLDKILTEEGYITMNGTIPTYHYYLQDHEGNNRVVINQSGTVEQVNHYYPFGTLFAESTNDGIQKYKYNGKELDRQYSLNLYDYGARYYDSVLGQWTAQDPMAVKYYDWSSYNYCKENPISFLDINGMDWIEAHYYNKQSENDEYFFFYDNRIQNESDIITYYGENSDIYYLGFSATISEKSGNTILQTIKLLPNGNFTINGETQESDYNDEGLLHIGSIKRVDNNSLGKNFYGNYLGPKNPILLQKQISDNKDEKKQLKEAYTVPPKNLLDYAAYLHDKGYDKYSAVGSGGAFTSFSTSGEDLLLANNCLLFLFNNKGGFKEHIVATATAVLFNFIGTYKSIYNGLFKP